MISGTKAGFDVEDLEVNCSLRGFERDGRVIKWLWRLLREFSDQERGDFFLFCTGCSRAPLLGCRYLNPIFSIVRAQGEDRLPTAATCSNTLGLSDYSSYKLMKEKVLYAINSNSGFMFA